MGCVSREETTHLAWRSRQFDDVLSVFVACHSRSLFLPPLLPGRHVVRFCQSRTRAQGYGRENRKHGVFSFPPVQHRGILFLSLILCFLFFFFKIDTSSLNLESLRGFTSRTNAMSWYL